mmetsp:Transcript_82861/g.101552  ORF Transcript_82861/g.101552 Transcript_82861/m.101552 type:complete len:446 (+) Transcript_82861:47-1384(+)
MRSLFIVLIILKYVALYGQIPNCNGGNDGINDLPGYPSNAPKLTMYSGYIQVNESVNGSLFYWFIESLSHSINTPLLVWLNGGPGASSLYGLFAENGPFRINSDGKTLSYNNYTWITHYHMLFVDQPIDTGFSFCNQGGWVNNEDLLGQNFVTFLHGFYQCHSNFKSNPLYITGESYAGKYIPFIGKHIIMDGTMNLKGLVIGNGHYDPTIMFTHGPRYAYITGILDEYEYSNIEQQINYCLNLVNTNCDLASDICLNVTNNIYAIDGGNIFQYDIRVLDADFFDGMSANIANYLSLPDVVSAIHTQGIPWKDSDGTSSPNPVFNALKCDVMLNNSAILIPYAIDNNIRVLFYNGQFDGSIWGNYGNQACLAQYNYKGTWNKLPKKVFYVLNDVYNIKMTAGYVKESNDKMLTYIVISDSGHLVPYDQPKNIREILINWIQKGNW